MRYLQVGAVIAGVAWLLATIVALFWFVAPNPNFLGLPTNSPPLVMGHLPGSLGSGRQAILIEATRMFRQGGKRVPPDVNSGATLAPVTFLNEHLKARGAKWRVRGTNGLNADIYEVS